MLHLLIELKLYLSSFFIFRVSLNELLYTLALQHVSKVGDIIAKQLISHCGSAEAVFKEKTQHLLRINGVGKTIVQELSKPEHLKHAELEIKFIQKHNIDVLFFQDDNYPKKLKHCIDGPVLLFKKGDIDFSNDRIISIVGTRKITSKGIDFCEHLIEKIAPYDPVIVSGLAYGTDITAHRSAMTYNLQTIACLAHGLNQIYPKVHEKYVSKIMKNGGLLSDFCSSDAFNRTNFLKRNRIIAGLSDATVVIESSERGGSLVTANIASSYNREIFAVPGRPTDIQSIGCNNLIKQHKAHMLTIPEDLPYMLNWNLESSKQTAVQKQLFVTLNDDETVIYNCLLYTSPSPRDGATSRMPSSA